MISSYAIKHGEVKGRKKRVPDSLLLFPNHCDRFLRAFVRADTTALAERQVNVEINIDRRVRAIQCTEPALVAFLFIDDWFKNPPRSGLSRCPLCRFADSEALTNLAHTLISLYAVSAALTLRSSVNISRIDFFAESTEIIPIFASAPSNRCIQDRASCNHEILAECDAGQVYVAG